MLGDFSLGGATLLKILTLSPTLTLTPNPNPNPYPYSHPHPTPNPKQGGGEEAARRGLSQILQLRGMTDAGAAVRGAPPRADGSLRSSARAAERSRASPQASMQEP